MTAPYMVVLVDKRILAGGAALLVSGFVISAILGSNMPLVESGMTDEAAMELILEQRQNRDMNTLAGIMVGVGFLLVLVSFGVRRRALKTKGGK